MRERGTGMTRVVLFMAAWAALAAAAAEEGGAPALTPEERQQRMLAATGGFVTSPGTGGAVLLLDMTGGRAGQTVAETARLLGSALRVRAVSEERRPQRGIPEREIRAALAGAGTAAAVAVIADPAQPGLLIAPEDRWAVVNAARVLAAGGEQRDVRLRKEIWRAVGLLMGAGSTGAAQCPFRPVFSAEDLDAFTGFQLAPATLSAVSAYAKAAGIAQVRQTTYRKACEEGWAPAPTNDFQRAIWEEVKGKK